MTWDPVLVKAPVQAEQVWDTNERILQEWVLHTQKRGAKNTQRNRRVYVSVFVRMFQPLVTTLDRSDMEAFVARISQKCSKLMNGKHPQCLANVDLAICPLLRNRPPYTACPKYQPLDPAAVWSYICCVNAFYEWLLEQGRVARNPMIGVMRDFLSRHSALFDERRRKPRRRNLEVEEVRSLVENSPLYRAIGYMLMAKCFLRIHEVLKLRVDSDFLDVEAGWMDIPTDWDLGNKRKGNKRIILDAELKRWMRRYLKWRDMVVKRNADGTPTTQTLLITMFGEPWGIGSNQNYNKALHGDAVRLNLMTGHETERKDKVQSHCYRAFATTYARAAGCGLSDIQILRGDLAPGSIERYDDYIRRLPDLYQRYGPVLGV